MRSELKNMTVPAGTETHAEKTKIIEKPNLNKSKPETMAQSSNTTVVSKASVKAESR